eukprot:m.21033 g.21033  ORF g.21033 m.21033 type:complete len:166 (-) comp5319_c0_seq1:373-870(-)
MMKKRKKQPVPIRLSLAHRDISDQPKELTADKMKQCRELDLSHNNFTSLHTFIGCENIECLVVDHNKLKSHVSFPHMPHLRRLWVNHNSIDNLVIFIDTIVKQFPNLVELNMLNNPAAPSYLNGGSVGDHQEYRNYVISHLPKLQHLDFVKIERKERRTAISGRH